MKLITYVDSGSGNLSVIYPAYQDQLRSSDETDEELLARVIAKSVPDGVSHQVIDDADILSDRTFRDAWEPDASGKPLVNMPKARVIHMGRIRLVRNKELLGLDWQLSRAQETNNTAEEARIKTLKQTLRDIPATFDLSDHITATALKAAWPAELPAQEESE